ncbi:MAG: nucleoside deaminase [Acholeplasmatales bacterium]|nr:nucleoside deaminase [Acholeplasmatales bacterium]
MNNDEYFMKEALKEARLAYFLNEIPIGCVIVKDNKIIARGRNQKEEKKQVFRHAEINAIEEASKYLDTWRLKGCSLYVTMEPCAMCMGAIMQSQISDVYFSFRDTSMGACGSVIDLSKYNFQNPKINIHEGLFEEEAKNLLKQFFLEIRKK